MLITYNGLIDLVKNGVIEGVEPERINAASVDVCLGDVLWIESERGHIVDLAEKDAPHMTSYRLSESCYPMAPGEFVLGSTREVFHLPDDIACEFKLKSSLARSGLQHAVAGWADPGFHNSVLTLELSNCLRHHPLMLRAGMPIGQLVFFRGESVPNQASYAHRGQYCNDREAQPSKGVR